MGVRNETIYVCDRCTAEERQRSGMKTWTFISIAAAPQSTASKTIAIALCSDCTDVFNAAIKPVSR